MEPVFQLAPVVPTPTAPTASSLPLATPLSALSPQRGLLLLPPEQPCEVTEGALNLRLEPDSDQGGSETWPYDLSFTNIVCFLCDWFLSAWPTGASLPGMTAPQMTAAETPQDREQQTFSVKG